MTTKIWQTFRLVFWQWMLFLATCDACKCQRPWHCSWFFKLSTKV